MRLEFTGAFGGHRFEQRERELPADHGGDLGHFARVAEAVETRHQRILQRRRHRTVLAGRFHHASGQFLDEQRNAIGLGDDRGDGLRRQAVRGGDAGDQLRAFWRPSRPSVTSVACGRASQGGAKSGRAVTTASAAPGRCCRSAASSFRAWWRRSNVRLPARSARDRCRPGERTRRPAAPASPPCVAPASATTARLPRGGSDSNSASNAKRSRVRSRAPREQGAELLDPRVRRIRRGEARRRDARYWMTG